MGLLLATTGCQHQSQPLQKSTWVKCDTVRTLIGGKQLQFPAQVVAAEEVHLSFKVSGTLERMFAEEGKAVRQGGLLAQMNPRDYELQLQAVEGEYLRIKADAERAFALYADSVIPVADYDKARYGLQQITAKHEQAKNQLTDTRLYAPFNGVVKRCLFDPPALVAAGMPVVTMLSSAMPEIRVYVPASVYQHRHDISACNVTFDFLPVPIPLEVISIAPHANADQLYAIRLALPQEVSERPSVGMSAMVSIDFTGTEEGVFRIPACAIFHKKGNDYVWIVHEGKATRCPIKVKSLHTDGTANVVSGLTGGEVIITAGVHSLTEGQPVKPLPATRRTNIGGAL